MVSLERDWTEFCFVSPNLPRRRTAYPRLHEECKALPNTDATEDFEPSRSELFAAGPNASDESATPMAAISPLNDDTRKVSFGKHSRPDTRRNVPNIHLPFHLSIPT